MNQKTIGREFALDSASVPVVTFDRVSAAKQEANRRISELGEIADDLDWDVVVICKESVSGAAGEDERQGDCRVLPGSCLYGRQKLNFLTIFLSGELM